MQRFKCKVHKKGTKVMMWVDLDLIENIKMI